MQLGTRISPGTSSPKPLRVALVDDCAVVRKMFSDLFLESPEVDLVGIWADGEQALAGFAKILPDVMLVDLNLPGMSGEECLLALAAIRPATAFVVVTAQDDPERVFASLRAGANGYLLKSASPLELISGIKAAHAGGTPLSPEVARLVIQAFRNQLVPVKTPIPLPTLSPREMQILELLAMGRVPKEVAAELAITYQTTRDYLKHIYRKLHVRSRTEAVLKYLDSGDNRGH